MTDQHLLDDLLELERAGWRSRCESTGDRFYGDLMTDDALMVLANGAVMDRDAVTAELGQAPPWRSFEFSDERGAWCCITRRRSPGRSGQRLAQSTQESARSSYSTVTDLARLRGLSTS